VADYADFHQIVLAELPRIFINVDEANVFGDCAGWLVIDILPEQIHADD